MPCVCRLERHLRTVESDSVTGDVGANMSIEVMHESITAASPDELTLCVSRIFSGPAIKGLSIIFERCVGCNEHHVKSSALIFSSFGGVCCCPGCIALCRASHLGLHASPCSLWTETLRYQFLN